jgi:uncharacterized membrane protein
VRRLFRPSRATLVGVMGLSGVLHFAAPRFYRAIVPRWIGHEKEIVAVSGVAELACAGALVLPSTRRLGGWLTAALLVAVFPANLQAALDGGYTFLRPPFDSPLLAWARLPLQLPLIVSAVAIGMGEEV